MTPTPKRLAIITGSTTLIIVAFLRGNHLLGIETGAVYALVATGILALLAQENSRWIVALIAMMSIPVAIVMAYPASFSPDLQHFIDKQATDRAVCESLYHVFDSDPAFADLSVSTVHLKVVNFTIHGALHTKADFERLRRLIVNDRLVRGPLHWDILLLDTGTKEAGLDRELFPDTKKSA